MVRQIIYLMPLSVYLYIQYRYLKNIATLKKAILEPVNCRPFVGTDFQKYIIPRLRNFNDGEYPISDTKPQKNQLCTCLLENSRIRNTSNLAEYSVKPKKAFFSHENDDFRLIIEWARPSGII